MQLYEDGVDVRFEGMYDRDYKPIKGLRSSFAPNSYIVDAIPVFEKGDTVHLRPSPHWFDVGRHKVPQAFPLAASKAKKSKAVHREHPVRSRLGVRFTGHDFDGWCVDQDVGKRQWQARPIICIMGPFHNTYCDVAT